MKQRAAEWEGWTPTDHVSLVPISSTTHFGGVVTKEGYRITPKDSLRVEPGEAEEYQAKLEAVVAHGVQQVLRDVSEEHRGQVIIRNPHLHNTFMSTKWTRFANFSVTDLLNKFLEAKQSEDSKGGEPIRLEDCEFDFVHVEVTRYGTLKSQRLESRLELDCEEWAGNKKSLVDPIGAYQRKQLARGCEDWCMVIALLLGKHRVDHPTLSSSEYTKYHQRTGQLRKDGLALIAKAGVSSLGPHTLDDLTAFQKALGDEYQVCCFGKAQEPFRSEGPRTGKPIHLFLKGEGEGHVWLITSVVGFLARFPDSGDKFFWCPLCQRLASKDRHRCEAVSCKLCKSPGCENTSSEQLWQNRNECEQCGLTTWSQACSHHHKDQKGCGKWTKCPLCFTRHKDAKKHKEECGVMRYCDVCKAASAAFDHVCYIQKAVEKPVQERRRWYGDIESRVDDNGVHIPNLLILKSGETVFTYWGDECVEEFIEATSLPKSPFTKSYVIFHNLGGYDGHFFLQCLVKMSLKPDDLIIQQGSQILAFSLPSRDIKFRDSLRFIPNTPLSSFPAMFGLSEAKGMFPHTLNRPEHLDAETFGGQRFPPASFFEPEKMSPKSRKTFEVWWEAEKTRFDADPQLRYRVREELEMYCLLDVDILMKGFEQFLQDAAAKHPEIDPLSCITSPSFCNRAFRQDNMDEESIALLPPKGFDAQSSKDEIAWLLWKKKEWGLVELRHNRNFRPIVIRGFKVDGYGKDKDGLAYVFEYDGCHWHGCQCSIPPGEEKLAESKRLRTKYKHEALKAIGGDADSPYGEFCFVTIKECEYKEQLERNEDMRGFVRAFKKGLSSERLSLEESFFGGRTTPIMHRVDAEEGEKIGYADFTSLYPAVNACTREGEEYPVGYPTVFLSTELEQFAPLDEAILNKTLFGMVHCELDPPSQLRHAVVPVRQDGKLLFPLCRACAREANPKSCRHSKRKRRLRVHLPTPEIRKALQVGYRLHKVFEAWHWEKRSSTLLRGYVTTHYMEKEYASGFPGGVESQEQKQAHADACSRSLFGEPADVSKFAENSGKRTLAKGMLNNFWGYFGKRDDHAQHNFVTTKEELLKIIHDQSLDIVSFDMTPNGDVALVGTKTKIPKPSAKTSRLIAAFTTSMARLRLYNVLEAHSDSVIYMDTDSVYYIYSEHNPGPSTPGTLGELKNELRPGCYISKMSCTGPKSYATVTKDREGAVVDTAVHLKGISAGACRVVPLVEHSEIRKLVDGDALNISVPQTQFRKDLASQTVTTRDFQKSIRYYSTKRRFILNSQRQDTLPYGYTD